MWIQVSAATSADLFVLEEWSGRKKGSPGAGLFSLLLHICVLSFLLNFTKKAYSKIRYQCRNHLYPFLFYTFLSALIKFASFDL